MTGKKQPTEFDKAKEAVKAAAQEAAGDGPITYEDNRVALEFGELSATIRQVQELVTPDWLTSNIEDYGYSSADKKKRVKQDAVRAIVETVIRSINYKRLAHPEGTIARNEKTEAFACRYYSRGQRKLIWAIIDKPSDKQIVVDEADSLSAADGWKIIYQPDWPVEQ